MAEFEAKVYRLKIEEHPNADALEIARVGDYRSIVRKGQYKTGDLGVYILSLRMHPIDSGGLGYALPWQAGRYQQTLFKASPLSGGGRSNGKALVKD